MQPGSRPLRPILIACLGGVALVPAPAFAAGASATVAAQAAILHRLGLVSTRKLDFGTIAAGNSAGTVTVGQDGSVSTTGGVVALGPASTAEFTAYSQRNQTVSLRLQSNSIQATRAGGSQAMTVDHFTISSTPPSTLSTTATTFTLNTPNGVFAFDVGATLHVLAHQTPGTYQGTFMLTIQYN